MMALKQLQDLLDLLFIKEIEVLLLAAEQIDLKAQLKLILAQGTQLKIKPILQKEKPLIVILGRSQTDHLQVLDQIDHRLDLILRQELASILIQGLEEGLRAENLLQVAVAQREAEKDNLTQFIKKCNNLPLRKYKERWIIHVVIHLFYTL